MRRAILATVSMMAAAACGRIGYDATGRGDDAADDTDAAPGIATACNMPVNLMDLPVPAGKSITALDVGATTSGFVIVWPIEDAVYTTGFDVGVDNDFSLNQTAAIAVGYGSPDVSIASLGDDALLAVDNVAGNGIYLYPLAKTGYDRGESKSIDGFHAHGNSYLAADVGRHSFAGTGDDATNAVSYVRDVDAHPYNGPTTDIASLVPDNTGITAIAGGYAVINGRPSECHIIAVDAATAPMGSEQIMNMTCHNATIATSATSDKIVAAWNCEDNMVWLTGGSMSSTLPMYHSLYGDVDHSSTNPRLAPTTAGIWYGFQVAGGRLGRALVDDDGNPMASVTPDVVVAGGVGHYDLVSRNDQAFLFWTAPGPTSTSLWTMRLCAP